MIDHFGLRLTAPLKLRRILALSTTVELSC